MVVVERAWILNLFGVEAGGAVAVGRAGRGSPSPDLPDGISTFLTRSQTEKWRRGSIYNPAPEGLELRTGRRSDRTKACENCGQCEHLGERLR